MITSHKTEKRITQYVPKVCIPLVIMRPLTRRTGPERKLQISIDVINPIPGFLFIRINMRKLSDAPSRCVLEVCTSAVEHIVVALRPGE